MEDLFQSNALEGVSKSKRTTSYQVDLRYLGQGLTINVDFEIADLKKKGLDAIGDKFDELHEQLFTFSLDEEKELVNLRAALGLDNDWSLRIIKQVGNYGESYKRNIADTGILPDRGPNELWTKGGILYVPPAR